MASLTSVTSYGPWGGPGGDIWKYQTGNGITNIIMQVGGNIKSIYFRDSADRTSGVLGGMGQDPSDRGEQKTVNIKWPEEYIKSIGGTYGLYKGLQVITSLSFTTNLCTYGPFGTANGTRFSSPVLDSNHAIVGFYGKFGYYLDSIGTLAAPIPEKPPVSIAAVGGPGGKPWSYVTNKGISKIVLNYGQNVKSLIFQDSTGTTSAKFGGQDCNDVGKQETIYIDSPCEFMTSIEGTYGVYAGVTTITSISFVTNKKMYGPYGMRGHCDKEYSLSSSNTKIVGFHGKAGYYIDSIGTFVRPI